MSNYKRIAEQIFALPKTKELLENYADEEFVALKIESDLARTENYKENIFYHATGYQPDCMGEGLHLGKDKRAVIIFIITMAQKAKLKNILANLYLSIWLIMMISIILKKKPLKNLANNRIENI